MIEGDVQTAPLPAVPSSAPGSRTRACAAASAAGSIPSGGALALHWSVPRASTCPDYAGLQKTFNMLRLNAKKESDSQACPLVVCMVEKPHPAQ